MPGHVYQDIASVIGKQPLGSGHLLPNAIREKPYEALDRDFVTPIIDLDIVSIKIDGAVCVAVDGSGEGVARVTCHVIGEHEDYLGVWDSKTLDRAVEGENIGEMAVVEPESRRRYEDGPVGCVFCCYCYGSKEGG